MSHRLLTTVRVTLIDLFHVRTERCPRTSPWSSWRVMSSGRHETPVESTWYWYIEVVYLQLCTKAQTPYMTNEPTLSVSLTVRKRPDETILPLSKTCSIFIGRQHTDARYWYSNYVRLSIRPSVRHVPVFYGNGLSHCYSFFTIR